MRVRVPRAHLGTSLGTAQTLADRSRNPRGTRTSQSLCRTLAEPSGTLAEPSRSPRGIVAEPSRNLRGTRRNLASEPPDQPGAYLAHRFQLSGEKKEKGAAARDVQQATLMLRINAASPDLSGVPQFVAHEPKSWIPVRINTRYSNGR